MSKQADGNLFDRSLPTSGTPGQHASVDYSRLRSERLAKVQGAMAEAEISALLLTDAVNIRYCTGLDLMTIWSATNLWQYVLIPETGTPVIFAHEKERSRAESIWPDVRNAHAWQGRFSAGVADLTVDRWSQQIYETLVELKLTGAQVGVDRLDIPGMRGLEKLGLKLVDGDRTVAGAREVKTQDELQLLRKAASVGEIAMYELQQSIRPGVTENQLLSVFMNAAIAQGAEYSSTRLLSSGYRTNPWYQEASDKPIRPGDIVAMDTDLVAAHGYVCDFSRSFLCATTPNAKEADVYKFGVDFIESVKQLIRPGASLADIARAAPKYPTYLGKNRYPIILHGVGMEDEGPFLPFIDDLETHEMPDGEIRPDTVLSVEFYGGPASEQFGIKLEDMVLVSENNAKTISCYPFSLIH